jgi:uncharacterized SAM-binding protein YcdF (DUF218 family)
VHLIRKHPVVTVIGTVALLAVAAIASSAVVVWRAAHHDGASDLERADTIVVLGAAQYDGTPSPVFEGRLDHAFLLWRQDRADTVMVLGSKQPADRTTEADSGRRYLIDQGIPADQIMAVPVGRTSFESLRAAARQMRSLGLETAFLVSDPWHNARIGRMAGDLGIEAYPSATWTSAATTEETRSQGYLRETFAYLYYRLTGR